MWLRAQPLYHMHLIVQHSDSTPSKTLTPDVSQTAHLICRVIPKEDQRRLGVIDGQLVVLYDVEREEDTGQLQVVDGYFIHYFAPHNLTAGSKNIIFCLDISGSMAGSKLNQTKEAMTLILKQLRREDHFNIISFSDDHQSWKYSCVDARKKNIEKALQHVQAIQAGGGTNIYSALRDSISKLQSIKNTEALDNVIILLTDGQHNDHNGEVSSYDIPSQARRRIRGTGISIKIHGLGFGKDADFMLLKELAAKTGGLARRIYADSDAAIQLHNFYDEISSPTLANLNIKYLEPNVDPESIVESARGGTLYDGSEMIYCGRLKDTALTPSIHTNITAQRSTGQFHRDISLINSPFPDLIPGMDLYLNPTPTAERIPRCIGSIVERSWAYLTIKKLLETASTEKEAASHRKYCRKEALTLSLKYGFVTGVTSMVAVQPTASECTDKKKDVAKNDSDSTRKSERKKFPFLKSKFARPRVSPPPHSPSGTKKKFIPKFLQAAGPGNSTGTKRSKLVSNLKLSSATGCMFDEEDTWHKAPTEDGRDEMSSDRGALLPVVHLQCARKLPSGTLRTIKDTSDLLTYANRSTVPSTICLSVADEDPWHLDNQSVSVLLAKSADVRVQKVYTDSSDDDAVDSWHDSFEKSFQSMTLEDSAPETENTSLFRVVTSSTAGSDSGKYYSAMEKKKPRSPTEISWEEVDASWDEDCDIIDSRQRQHKMQMCLRQAICKY